MDIATVGAYRDATLKSALYTLKLNASKKADEVKKNALRDTGIEFIKKSTRTAISSFPSFSIKREVECPYEKG